MGKVTGIGGIFFKAKEPVKLQEWYRRHLGIDVQGWGGTTFRWHETVQKNKGGSTTWTIGEGSYFAPSDAPFMVNYRVCDLPGLLVELRANGCNVLDKTEESEYGKFAWLIDPEGNKVELWEPPVGE